MYSFFKQRIVIFITILLALLITPSTVFSQDSILTFSTQGQQYGVADLDHFWLSSSPDNSGIFMQQSMENPESSNVGKIIYRANAYNNQVWGQFGCSPASPWTAQSGSIDYNVHGNDSIYIKIRYSKNSNTNKSIDISVNGTLQASFTPINQYSWTDFTTTEWIELQFPPRPVYWQISGFGKDHGHNNTYILQRDGSPVCKNCWNMYPLVNDYNDGGVSFTLSENGSLNVSYVKDMQIYGSTWIKVNSNKNLTPDFFHDVGRIWLNNNDITNTVDTSGMLLVKGWNHLEWTAYNQNRNSGFTMTYNLISNVEEMSGEKPDIFEPHKISFYTDGQQYGVAELDHLYISTSESMDNVFFDKPMENISSSTIGDLIYRANAINDAVWGQFGCLSSQPYNSKSGAVNYENIEVPSQFYIKIRYSKHSSGSVPIQILIDDNFYTEFTPVNQSSWENFTETDWILIQQ